MTQEHFDARRRTSVEQQPGTYPRATLGRSHQLPRLLGRPGHFGRVGRVVRRRLGVFLQLTADHPDDRPIPGWPYSFGRLIDAQARGEREALRAHDRPVVHVHLGANLIGTFLFAAMILPEGLLAPEVYPILGEIAIATMESPFWVTLLKAIFAGWLIALMVWLLPNAGSARLLVILLLTYVVALGHLSHIIAGSVEAAYAVLEGQASLGRYLTAFLLPTLIGNTIGGVSLVAFLNHAPLRAEGGVPSGAGYP